MPTFLNIGFEDAGVLAGEADQWTWAFVSSAEEWADFDVLLGLGPYEDFNEGWLGNENHIAAFEPADLAVALYNVGGDPEEAFEREWAGGNETHYESLPVGSFAEYNTPPEPREPFEQEWAAGNENDLPIFVPADLAPALYGGVAEPHENFEQEWAAGNENDIPVFVPANIDAALYGVGVAVEDFEAVNPFQIIVVVLAAGNSDDTSTVKIDGVPVSYDYTGVGGPSSVRNGLVAESGIVDQNAEFVPLGVAFAQIRHKTPGQAVFAELITTGVAEMEFGTPPNPLVSWTSTGSLEY